MPKKCFSFFFFLFSLHSVCRTVILGLKDIVQEESGYAKLQSQFGVIRKTETAENKTWSPTQGVVKFCIKACNTFLQQILEVCFLLALLCGLIRILVQNLPCIVRWT